MTPQEAKKQLVSLLRENSNRHNLYDVFRDFAEMAALAISNSVDLLQRQPREARYLQLIERYRPEEQRRFPQMLGALTIALEAEPDDILGQVFSELELTNAARGQFFTPYSLCALLGRINISADQAREQIALRGFATMHEPACGAGAMVIAVAGALHAERINYQQHLHVTAVDIDPRAVHMAYLQFSLLGIPAVVMLGNTLTMEFTEQWHTPMHVTGLWPQKLRRGYALGSAMDPETAFRKRQRPAAIAHERTHKPLPVGPAVLDAQLELFA
jgi:type I restriction-modification system DNA methylase subunit